MKTSASWVQQKPMLNACVPIGWETGRSREGDAQLCEPDALLHSRQIFRNSLSAAAAKGVQLEELARDMATSWEDKSCFISASAPRRLDAVPT
jgi:hypothetical protein